MVEASVAIRLDIAGKKVTLSSLDPITEIKQKGFEVAMPEDVSITLPSLDSSVTEVSKAFDTLLKSAGVANAAVTIDIASLPDFVQTAFAELSKLTFSIDAMRLKVVPKKNASGAVTGYDYYYDVTIGVTPTEKLDLSVGDVTIDSVGFRLFKWPKQED